MIKKKGEKGHKKVAQRSSVFWRLVGQAFELEGLTLWTGFVILLVVIMIFFLLWFSSTKWAMNVSLAHTPTLDLLYHWLDPFFIYSISGWGVLFLLVYPGRKWVKRIGWLRMRSGLLAFVMLLVLTAMLYGLSEFLLKPIFSKCRPRCLMEHLITAAALDEELSAENLAKLRGSQFVCPVAQVVFDTTSLGGSKVPISNEGIHGALVRRGLESNLAKEHLRSIVNRTGVGTYDVPANEIVDRFLDLSSWKAKRVKLFFTPLVLREKDDESCNMTGSCPSGHVIRQAIVLFLAIIAVFRWRQICIFEGNPHLRWYFLTVYLLVYLVCMWSRAYGYQHTWSDETISTVLAFVLLLAALVFSQMRESIERNFSRRLVMSVPFHRLIQAASVMVVYFDKYGDFLVWNEQCERVTGWQRKEIQTLNDYVKKLYPDSPQNEMRRRLRRAIDTGSLNRNVATVITTAEGKKKTILWNATPFCDTRNRIIGKLSIGVEISWLERRLSDLGFASAGLLHDLADDMATMYSTVEEIEKLASCNQQVVGLCTTLKEMVERLDGIAEIYSSYARAEKRVPETVQVEQVVSLACDLIRQRAKRRSISIKKEISSGLPSVGGYPTALRQAFVNLLRNAVTSIEKRCEYDEHSPKEIKVRVTSDQDHFVVVEVSDTGEGLPDSVRHTIEHGPTFETVSDVDAGIGLGLIVIWRIVMDHGGSINYLPRDVGTTIIIRLPVREESVV